MRGMALDPTQLQQAAKDHLWMHFTRHGSYKDADVPVIVRGEGPYIWDSNGKKYLDALAGLFVSQLGHGRADLAEAAAQAGREAGVHAAVVLRAPERHRAGRPGGRLRARLAQPGVLHQRWR